VARIASTGEAVRATARAYRNQRDLAGHVGLLITSAAIAASVLLVSTFGEAVDAVRHEPRTLVVFGVLALVLQLFSFEVYGRGSMSVSAVGFLAAAFSLPVGAAVWIAVVAALAQWIRRRGALHKAIFDAANFALSMGAAAILYSFVDPGHPYTQLFVGTAAGIVYSAINHGMLCLAMSLSEGTGFRDVWLERFHWARHHILVFGPLAVALSIAYVKLGVIGLLAFALPPAVLVMSVRQYLERTRLAVEEIRKANEELREANAAVRKTMLATIAALSRSMEAKDYYTGGHTERVSLLAVALARRLGYSGTDLDAVEIGALLHDIGKIGIPERILHKPGPLDEKEWEVMKEHPKISEYILSGVDLPEVVLEIARSSHERMDGAGYPDGLAGESIPLPARIVLVADAFDALTSDRPYRRARSPRAAMEEIQTHSGTQFCPRVVAALQHVYREEPYVLAGRLFAVEEDAA
jgi:putative nucleotidyltransferase with HDIG domain